MSKRRPPKSVSSLYPHLTSPLVRGRNGGGALALALVLGALVRLFYLLSSKNSPFYEPLLLDPEYYHTWALRIARGDWVGEGVFYGLPLYPYFLGVVYKISQSSLLLVKIIQLIFGLVTIFFVYRIGDKLVSRSVATLAAFMAVFYGPLFFHESILIPESLSVPLYAMSFYFSLKFLEGPSFKKGLGLGALFGLAALTKAGILLYAFLFVGGFFINEFRKSKKILLPPLLCLIALLGVLAPVSLHNFYFGKDKVLLTSHAGFNFYIGNNPKAEGVFAAPEGTGTNVKSQIEDSREVAEKEMDRTLKPSEVSAYWSNKAWRFIQANPERFFTLCFKKFILFFDSREISDVEDYAFSKKLIPFLNFPWFDFTVLGPLVILGIWFLARGGRFRFWTFAWVFSYLLGMITFFVNARYRLPLLSVFFVLAAAGAFQLYRCFTERRWKRALAGAAILALGAGVSQAHLVGTSWARDYVNAGDALVMKKNYEEAMPFYEKALQTEPRSAKANQAMGVLLTRMGRHSEAKDFYLKSLEAEPNNAQVLNNLGMWYDQAGDAEQAKEYFLKALELKPKHAQAHNNLGMLYGKAGENEKAIHEFEESLKSNPDNPRALTNLGLVLYRLGQKDKARRFWQKALKIDPEFSDARRALASTG